MKFPRREKINEDPRYFMVTVQHTGTVYFLTQLKRILGPFKFQHCGPISLDIAKQRKNIFTTYRDPYRTAASWYNREVLQDKHHYKKWNRQWEIYWEIRKLDPLVFDFTKGERQHGFIFDGNPRNTSKDKYGLHKALDENDLQYFHRHIPEELINAAQRTAAIPAFS